MSYIYSITNQINGHRYIGKTTEPNPETRWKGHLIDSKNPKHSNRPIYRAFKKYGIDNFIFEILEEVEDSVLDEREVYWIAYYNTFFGDGYNATIGGDGTVKYDYEEIYNLIEQNWTSNMIVQKIGCSKDVIFKVAKKYGVQDKIIQAGIEENKRKLSKKVAQINKDNHEIIQYFNSTADAARFLVEHNLASSKNLSGIRSHIGAVCNGKRKTAYKYMWQYV